MSDIWEKPQELLNPNTSVLRNNKKINWQVVEEKFDQRRIEKKENEEKWGFTLPDDQYMALNTALAEERISIDEGYKIAASYALSSQYNLPPEYIRENYDMFLSAMNAPAEGYRSARTAGNFILNKLRSGASIFENSRLGGELRQANSRGDTKYAEEIQKLRKEFQEELYYNSDPNEKDRNFLMRSLGAAAESLPFTAYVAGTAFIGSLLAPGVGTAAAFTTSMGLVRDIEYAALIDAGAKHEVVNGVSLLSSAIQAGFEVVLGNALSIAGGAVKMAGRNLLTDNVSRVLIEKATANTIKNAHGKGLFLKTALKLGGEYAGEMLEEGLEELLQEFTSIMSFEVANALQGGGVETYNPEEIKTALFEAFKGGAMASIFLGIAGTGMNANASMKSWQNVKDEAELSQSEAEYINRTKDSEIWKHLPEEERLAHQKAAFAEGQKKVKQEEAERAKELKNKRLYGAMDTSGNTYRDDNKNLYMEVSRHVESNGTVEIDFAAGDPHKSEKNSYAIGKAEIRGDKAAITEFRIGKNYEGLQNEILQNFANDIGKEIEYSGQRYAPNGAGASLRFGWGEQANNTVKNEKKVYGFNFDRQPYSTADTQADTAAKQNFKGQLKSLDTKMGDAEVNTTVNFYDTIGRKWFGMSFDNFMNRMTGGRQQGWLHQMNLSDEQAARYIATKQGVLTDAAAVQQIQENLTDAQREEAMASIHGFAVTGADGVTKAIYAARDADFSTFIHEGVHAFTKLAEAVDPALYREMMEAAGFSMDEYNRADAAGKEQMTRQAMEKLAYGAEAYLKEGPKSVQNTTLKNLYDKIKEFLKDLADAVEKGKFLTPEVRSLFDNLFGEEANAAASENVNKSSESVTKTKENDNKNTKSVSESEEYEIYSEKLKRDIKDESLPEEARCEAAVKLAEQVYFQTNLEEINNQFNQELDLFLKGELKERHVFKLGTPGEILRRTGFPAGHEIELTAKRLKEKSNSRKHTFDPALLKDIVKEINKPIAVFFYGKNYKARNVIIDVKQNDTNFLVGIHFDKGASGTNVSEIRGLYPKDTKNWLNWINQGKLLYTNIEKLQAVMNHLQPNAVDMIQHNLEPIARLIQDNKEVKHYFTEENSIYFSEKLSDIEHTAEEKEIINTAKAVYGTTADFREAGYLLTDGSMLDFSGKTEGGSPGHRALDHREMDYFKHEGKEYTPGMLGFMQMGNIRVSPESGGLQLTRVPTAEQAKKIRRFIQYNNGDVIIDFANKQNLDNEAYVEYTNANENKVINDIINYYDKGIVPEENQIYFQTAFHGSPFINDLNRSNYFQHGWGRTFYSQKEAAQWAQNAISKTKGVEGQLLNASIPDDTNLLHWDNTIAEQPEAVRKIAESLITWNKNGKSEFNSAYNIRKFHDSSYGFYRSINGKAKWETIEEAQAAAREEIKKTLTGEDFYNTLAERIGKKEMSLLLDHLGVRGTKYFDKNMEKIGAKKGYNYVIYGESEIDITQTFYSEAFRDAGLSEFIINYPEIVKEAARFKSGAEMAEYYADYLAMPDEVYKKAKALGYFDAIARAAQNGNAQDATNAISGVSADAAATALAAYGANISIALEAANLVRQDKWQDSVQLLEKNGVPRIDAETYVNIAKIFSKSEMSWLERMAKDEKVIKENAYQKNKWKPEDGAFFNTLVDGAKEIYQKNDNETLRTKLAGEERTAKSFVDMINTEKGFDDLISRAYFWQHDGRQRGETEEETKQNEAIYDRVRTVFNTNNGNWKAAFENIAAGKKVNKHTKQIIRGMIRNRPLQYMDTWAMMTGDETWLPEENDIKRIKRLDTEGLADEEYLEKQSPEELERIARRLSSDRIRKKIKDRKLWLYDSELEDYEKQLKEDMAKAKKLIAEREEGFKEYRRYLDLARSNARKEQILLEQEALDTSNEGLKTSRERTKELAKAHKQVRSTINEMERFMREDLLPSQKEAFMELQNQLRESERIQAELKAIGDIREIKKRNIRLILRKPDLKTVSLHEAKYIEWIQAHFDSYEAVARFIGRGAKDIRKLYNEFATNAEYRADLKKKLPKGVYKRIEGIVYEDTAAQKVRAYGKINAHDRRVLYRHLLDHQAIFEEIGIDITEEPRKLSEDEYNRIREEMKDLIPADVLFKLEGLLEPDPKAERNEYAGRRFKVENFTIEDIQTLAGVVSNLRKEGREREGARKEARSQLREEGREKILKTIQEHIPKNAIGYRMQGTASTKLEEEKRSGLKGVWYALHNARRFFRKLEGGIDGFLYNFITQREYAAFNQENSNVFRRREEVEKKLKDAKIDLKDLGRIKFTTFDGKEKTLDEMLTFYYAQFNERANHAVIFGNFASQEERNAIKALADNRDLIGQMELESKIAERYHDDMKKLDDFFAQEGNEKYKLVMNIIGEDYDSNYERLKEFVAREYNEELGSEQYYMPLMRLGIVAQEKEHLDQALADNGLSHCLNKGFTKGRVDIPSFGQQAIQAGFYSMWDRMVVKQEHLMAYDPLFKELDYIFQGKDSEALRDTLKSGYSNAALDFIKKFIQEMAAPPVQDNYAALNKMSRMLQGHYPAAVLGWRIASIVKQSIESPPPFFQYVFPWQYAAAGASCLKQETRDMIREKSVYMKARYFDPAAAVVKEMERMYLTGKLGKAEAVLAKIESTGMKGQEWIDAVCVMPGWLAAYNKKLAELNKKNTDMSAEEVEAESVKYADQVVRDCQPSSVLMDQIQLLKGEKHPLAKMFMLFQTPIASIFQQLFIDAPVNIKQGRVLNALWTWGIYALLAIVIGAMHEEDDDEEWNLKNRGIDALVMPISMIPIFGGDLSYAAESLLRNGKITTPRRSNFPVLDQGIRAINNISDEQWGKAGVNALKGFMYSTGLPVAAWQDIEKAIETGRPQRVIGIK